MFFTLTSPDGTLAQLVEQRTFNPFVVGSTPARPTKYWNKINSLQELLIFFRPKSIKVQSFILLFIFKCFLLHQKTYYKHTRKGCQPLQDKYLPPLTEHVWRTHEKSRNLRKGFHGKTKLR